MSTDGRERIERMWNQMSVWIQNSNWTDPDAADRAEQAVDDRGVDAFFDPLPGVPFNEAVSANYDDFKSQFGLETQTEREQEIRDMDDRQRRAAINEVESQFREFGIQAVADAFENAAPPELQQRFDDVFAEFGPDFYRTIAFNEISNTASEFDLDAQLISQSRLDALREQAEQTTQNGEAIRDAERQVLDRLEVAFGQRFDDLDDAVESLRDRIDALQDLDVRSGAIRLRGNRDARPSVAVEIGFGQFEQAVREQVDRAIDRDALVDPPRTYEQRVGSVRVVGDEIQTIDLTPIQIDRELTRAVIDSDELLVRFEIDADVDVATPPAPEVPEPPEFTEEEPDDPDETPTPDPVETAPDTPEIDDPDDDVDPEIREIADRVAAAESVADIADSEDTADLFTLAAAAGRDEIPDAAAAAIATLFTQASADERSRANAANPGVGELQRAVVGVAPGDVDTGGVDIEFGPENGVESVDDLIDEAEPDRPDETRQERFSDSPREGPGNRSEMTPDDFQAGPSDLFQGPGGIRTQRGSDRPDPFQKKADQRLAPLLNNRIQKAQAWIAAEQDRIDRGVGDPDVFWETIGRGIWGGTLTRDEFVNLSV